MWGFCRRSILVVHLGCRQFQMQIVLFLDPDVHTSKTSANAAAMGYPEGSARNIGECMPHANNWLTCQRYATWPGGESEQRYGSRGAMKWGQQLDEGQKCDEGRIDAMNSMTNQWQRCAKAGMWKGDKRGMIDWQWMYNEAREEAHPMQYRYAGSSHKVYMPAGNASLWNIWKPM